MDLAAYDCLPYPEGMVALACPHCSDTASVVPHGANRNGTGRLRCRACGKTFTRDGRAVRTIAERTNSVGHRLFNESPSSTNAGSRREPIPTPWS